MKKSYLQFIIVIVFLFAGFFLVNQPSKNQVSENIKYIKIAGQNIKVELALTQDEHRLGLSNRKKLPVNEGMLFIFQIPGKYNFWMKDMDFPIDIIWIDEDNKVIYIKRNAYPEPYPETYGPEKNAKYVLEVNSGFSEKNNLKEGDTVEFTY